MEVAARHFRAAVPHLPICLGMQLRPYSLGHHTLLCASASPFITNGSDDMRSMHVGLVSGAFICSRGWRETHEWFGSWKLGFWFRLWGFFMRRADIAAEAEVFKNYVAEGERRPDISSPANGKMLVARWESRIKLFLIKELRLTVEEAMDYPLAMAWQEYCAHNEQEDRMTLVSDGQMDAVSFFQSEDGRRMAREAEEAARKEADAMRKRN